jgi:formylglycine-generating enzyme required for sulfatase activity
VCGPVPSCIGLAKTCGPAGDQDCCASGLVTGGTFYRGDNPQYPATVSDFRLDKYEITVGRFRKFVAAYQQNMTTAGAGRNPNNPNDPGWDVDWNFDMPADKAALTTSLKCSGGTDVWHDSAGSAQSESLPLPCLSWFAAEAFCIWDGGRLATDAEWDYAASGGDEQRPYPWGSAAPDCAHANSGAAPCGDQVNRVGSESPLGDGRYGQADLAGNLREWTQDWFFPHNQSNDPVYSSTTCVNCAELTPYGDRIFWGGSFVDDLGQGFQFRAGSGPYYGSPLVGARCARMP